MQNLSLAVTCEGIYIQHPPLTLLGQKCSLVFTQIPAEPDTRHNQALISLNGQTVDARTVSTKNKSMQYYISTTVMLKAPSDRKVTIAAYCSHHNHTTAGTEVRFVSGSKHQMYDMVKLKWQQEKRKI